MKLYPKLDAYMISQRPESAGLKLYMFSSNKFRLQRDFKAWVLRRYGKHLTIKIHKGI